MRSVRIAAFQPLAARLRATADRMRQGLNSPKFRRLALVAGCVTLLAGVIISYNALPDGPVFERPVYLIYICAIGLPVMIFSNTWETWLSASLLGRSFTWLAALRIAILASAANTLPLPGGAVVRIAALRGAGTGYGSAGAVTVAIALVWLGLAFAYAGGWLTWAGQYAISLPFLAGGSVVLGGSLFWILWLSGSWRGAVLVFLLKVVSVTGGLLRMAWALMAFGVTLDMPSLSIFAVSGVTGSAVSFIPAGIGVNEAITAAFATVVAVPASSAFLAATLLRILSLAVQAPIALGLAVWMARSHPSQPAQPPASQP